MTTVELDPMFVKALKYLHSKAKDSGAQLKALLDDAVAQRKGLKVSVHVGDVGKLSPGRSKSDDDSGKKETEKRPLNKIMVEKDNFESDVKKLKLDTKSRSKDEKEARDKERAKREKEKKEKEEHDIQKLKEKFEKENKEKELANGKMAAEAALVISDEEEPASQINAGDFALEWGIACVVCRQFGVSSGNQLVECQECHNLYHQECHKPPVTEEDVSDPRFVWYCFRCTRSLKRMMTQKPTKPKVATPPASVAGKDMSTTPSKPAKTEISSKSVSQAFRKIDPKSIVSSAETSNLNSTSSKPMVGLAGLAANLHKSKGEPKSGSLSRKCEQKGDGVKSLSKLESQSSSSGNKYDSSSKPSSGNKSDGSTKLSTGNKLDRSSKPNGGNKSDGSSKTSSTNKSDGSSKPSNSIKSDGPSKASSSSKSEESKSENSKSAYKEEKEKDKKSDSAHKLICKTENKKSSDVPTKSSSSSSLEKEEKKFDKKTEPGKSPTNSEPSKLDMSSPKSSPPQVGSPSTPDSPSPSKFSSSTSNKQAVANLSLVTANKRMQMMKKKAQTKPGADKKLHIK